jgi:hypothetical protein
LNDKRQNRRQGAAVTLLIIRFEKNVGVQPLYFYW